MSSRSSVTLQLEAICLRFEEALRAADVSVAEVKAQLMVERAEIVRERYGHLLSRPKPKLRK